MTRESMEKHLWLIDANLRELAAKKALPENQFCADTTVQSAVVNWVVQLVESCSKMAIAIINLRRLKPSETYRGVFAALGRSGVITPELQSRMEALVAFRNAAVHIYWDVTPREIYHILQNDLGAIEEFARIAKTILVESQ
ncbi:MAG: DUF86 domain-containing protein [Candidatus Sumerlaeia bacterium]|nr:DUF86 domain-containing protein [Candidatus Sumerlaeia bacterium]